MRAFRTWSICGGGWLAAIVCACCLAEIPVNAGEEPAEPSARPTVAPEGRESALDQRVTLLSAELNLDAQQQTEVRRILEDQRRQVTNVWNDTSVPSAYRVNATRTISDRTGDRIRALLNEEQKAKYNKPRKPRETTEQSGTPSVEDWLKATNPK